MSPTVNTGLSSWAKEGAASTKPLTATRLANRIVNGIP
jgi:hypothetical protein